MLITAKQWWDCNLNSTVSTSLTLARFGGAWTLSSLTKDLIEFWMPINQTTDRDVCPLDGNEFLLKPDDNDIGKPCCGLVLLRLTVMRLLLVLCSVLLLIDWD